MGLKRLCSQHIVFSKKSAILNAYPGWGCESSLWTHLCRAQRLLFGEYVYPRLEAQKGLLENNLSLRTSPQTGVVPQGYFLRAQSPGFSNILVIKPGCFPFNRGAATPVTSVYSSQRHTFLTAPRSFGFQVIRICRGVLVLSVCTAAQSFPGMANAS